jgi:hypothetical protein
MRIEDSRDVSVAQGRDRLGVFAGSSKTGRF